MKLRRKIYTWYLLSIILSITLVFSTISSHIDISIFQTFLFLLVTTLPIILFVEYSILLRLQRISRFAREERLGNPIPIKDFGYDEVSDIVVHINDQSSLIQNKTAKIISLEKSFSSIVDDSPILVQKFDKDGNVTFINDSYAKHFDIKNKEEFIGKNIHEFLKERDYEFSLQDDLNILTAERPVGSNVHKRKSDGWILWLNKAIFDSHKNITGYQTIGIDITREKEAEERLKILTNNMSTIILWTNSDSYFNYVSSGIDEIVETSDQVSHIADFLLKINEIEPGKMQKLMDMASSLNEKETDLMKIFNVKENKYKWYEVTIKPGLKDGFLILIEDVDNLIHVMCKERKSSTMKDFICTAMSDLTSVNLKDLKPAIDTFAKNLRETIKSDFSIIILNELNNSGDIIFSSGEIKLDLDVFTPFLDTVIGDKSVAFNLGGGDIPKEFEKLMEDNHIHSIAASHISFNHTEIGIVLAGVYSKSYYINDLDDIDSATMQISGRILGTVLRPAIAKDDHGIDLASILK